MAHRNCFQSPNDNLSAGDYLNRKRAKHIYSASVNLAQQPTPGVYKKKTSIGGIGVNAKKKGTSSNGTYVGDIYIGNGGNNNSKGCLIGADSYEALLGVTVGKYLVDPINFDFRRDQAMWVGSLYQMDMSGTQTIVNHPQWPVTDLSTNTFDYPPSPDANQVYPDPSNNNIGLQVDYSYNIFYPQYLTQSSRGLCYLKNERSWKQWIRCLPYTTRQASLFYRVTGGFIGDFNYPKKFHFDCDSTWATDLSVCLVQSTGSSPLTTNIVL